MRLAAVLLLASCGRLGFDVVGAGPGDGPHGDTREGDAAGDAATLPPGPKIWLRMDHEPAGGPGIIDSAGGHVQTCAGACPMPALNGKHQGGYMFSMEEVDTTNAADLDSSSGFTAAIWVRLESRPASESCVWTKPFNNAMGYDTFTFCIQPDGTVTFDGEDPAGTAITDNVGPALALSVWHHLAITWDGTTRVDYVGGQVAGTTPVVLGAGVEKMALGAARASYYTQGFLDDAIYYTRALSPAEIEQLATP